MVTIEKVPGSTLATTKAFVGFCNWADSHLQLSLNQRFTIDAAETILRQTRRGEGEKTLFERWGKYKKLWTRNQSSRQRVYNAKSDGIVLLTWLLEDFGKEAGLSTYRIEKICELMRK